MANKIDNLDYQLPKYVEGYIINPRETYQCELKPWINPSVNEHDKVKIAKTCLALRNYNGGILIIGITDNCKLNDLPEDYDPDTIFTQDSIQSIVSNYSTQQFGVDVHHVQLSEPPNRRVVAIVVPAGITTPTMCKNSSPSNLSPKLVERLIYTRTIESNGTISSAPASQQDLENITKTCFNNRVADIGEFLTNHLTKENFQVLKRVIDGPNEVSTQNQQQELDEFAATSIESFNNENKDGGK